MNAVEFPQTDSSIASLKVSRLTLTSQLLRLGHLLGSHLRGGNVAALHRVSITFHRREVEPHMSADIIDRHTLTLAIHQAEVVLRLCLALSRQRSCYPQLSPVALRRRADQPSFPKEIAFLG